MAVKKTCPECGAEYEAEEGMTSCDECSRKTKMKNDKSTKTQVNRIDMYESEERWMTRPFERTPEGFLKGRAIVTSIGVFQYLDASGEMHGELRHPDDVFDGASLESLKMKPLTNDHPTSIVTPENIKELTVGNLGSNPSFTKQLNNPGGSWNRDDEITDGQHVAIDMVINEPEAIKSVLEGKRSLSCGYTCDLEQAPEGAVYLGMPYKYIQKNIRYNHVAIVDRARAGDTARIRMDSADCALHIDKTIPLKEEEAMETIKIDGVDYQAEARVIENLTKAEERADGLQSELTRIKAAQSTLEAERDTAKARVDQLETELKTKMDASSIQAAVAKRLTLERAAADAKVDFKADESDLDIQKKVIQKAFPKMDLKDRDAGYVAAAFDSALQTIEKSDNADADKRQLTADSTDTTNTTAKDEEKFDAAAARQRMVDDLTKRKE